MRRKVMRAPLTKRQASIKTEPYVAVEQSAYSYLVIERRAQAQTVNVTEEELIVALDDGRTISAPLAWFPRLLHGTPEERANWRLIGDGEGIHWPDLDEDIEVRHLLAGIPSQETQHSLQRWLQRRRQRGVEKQEQAEQ